MNNTKTLAASCRQMKAAILAVAVAEADRCNPGYSQAPQWGNYCLVSLRPWATWERGELTLDGHKNPAEVAYDRDCAAYYATVEAAATAAQAAVDKALAVARELGYRGSVAEAYKANYNWLCKNNMA